MPDGISVHPYNIISLLIAVTVADILEKSSRENESNNIQLSAKKFLISKVKLDRYFWDHLQHISFYQKFRLSCYKPPLAYQYIRRL